MFDLPWATHRHLIEPITNQRHVRITLIFRFLGFIDQIKKSQKIIPKLLLSHIMHDVRSTTGQNLRKIMLQTDKLSVAQLSKDDIKTIVYHPTSPEDKWKESFVRELLQVKDNQMEVHGFDPQEIDDILEHLCVSRHLVLLTPSSLSFSVVFLSHQKHYHSTS